MIRWLSIRRPSPIQAPSRPSARRWPLYAGLAAGLWLGYVLYVNTLSLPFLQGDYAHIRRLAGQSNPLSPFISAAGLSTYRPLGESLMKSWYLILGRHDALWLRFLNISMHALNVALVTAIAWRLDRSRWRYVTAGLAGILFSVLPFAYQAIPGINGFLYPLNNLLQLLMVLFYWEARVRRSNRFLAAALFLCFLSPFQIEYGLMSGGLLLAVEVALLLQRRQVAIWLGGPLLGLALNLIFLLIWLLLPKSPNEFGPATAEGTVRVSAYLLQGLTYPIARLALSIREGYGFNDLFTIALAGIPVLVVGFILLVRRRQSALLATSLLWFVLLNLPVLVSLNFDAVIESPRTLYPSGPALAWLWAAIFSALLTFDRQRASDVLLTYFALFAFLTVVVMNIDFVDKSLNQYHIVEPSLDRLAEVAREASPDDELLVVNMASWLSASERSFVLGNHEVQILPSNITVEDVFFATNEADHPATAVQIHNLRQPQPYDYGMYGQRVDWQSLKSHLLSSGSVYLAEYTPERVELAPAGRISGLSWPGELNQKVGAVFGETLSLRLKEYEVDGETVTVSLLWNIGRPVDEDLTVFVHLYGPDGGLIDQDDGYPLRGLSPFWLWEGDQTLLDRRKLSWPAGAVSGTYYVGVEVTNRESGDRLPAAYPDGRPLADDTVVLFQIDRP